MSPRAPNTNHTDTTGYEVFEMPARKFNETLGNVAGPYFAIRALEIDGASVVERGFFIFLEGTAVRKCATPIEAITGAEIENRKHRASQLLRFIRKTAFAYRFISAKAAGFIVECTKYQIDGDDNEIPSTPTFEVWAEGRTFPFPDLAQAHADLEQKEAALERRNRIRPPSPGR